MFSASNDFLFLRTMWAGDNKTCKIRPADYLYNYLFDKLTKNTSVSICIKGFINESES